MKFFWLFILLVTTPFSNVKAQEDSKNEVVKEMPRVLAPPSKTGGANIFTLFINKKSEVLALDELSDLSEVEQKVLDFFLVKAQKLKVILPYDMEERVALGIIYVKIDEQVYDSLFPEVTTMMERVHHQIQTTYSQQFYTMEFENLTEEIKSEIQHLLPRIIILEKSKENE